LPGCYSQGETIDEAMNNAREAIELHIQGLKDEGQEVPKEEGLVIGRVDVRAAQSEEKRVLDAILLALPR
jgi:predicted RNase H-like HicB family nuclease